MLLFLPIIQSEPDSNDSFECLIIEAIAIVMNRFPASLILRLHDTRSAVLCTLSDPNTTIPLSGDCKGSLITKN